MIPAKVFQDSSAPLSITLLAKALQYMSKIFYGLCKSLPTLLRPPCESPLIYILKIFYDLCETLVMTLTKYLTLAMFMHRQVHRRSSASP